MRIKEFSDDLPEMDSASEWFMGCNRTAASLINEWWWKFQESYSDKSFCSEALVPPIQFS